MTGARVRRLFFEAEYPQGQRQETRMQINSMQHASRQQLQDEVLALIRSRSTGSDPARNAADNSAVPGKRVDPVAAPVGSTETEAAVKEINHVLKVLSTSLHFEVDEQSGETLVKVVDGDSGEVLRQIPSETTLKIARSLDKLAGHLVNHSI
jgi:flagellar protein FlaG